MKMKSRNILFGSKHLMRTETGGVNRRFDIFYDLKIYLKGKNTVVSQPVKMRVLFKCSFFVQFVSFEVIIFSAL